MTNANAPLPTIQQNNALQIPSPVGSGVTVLASPGTTVLAPNASRRGVRFYNPNLAAMIYLFPDNMTPFIQQGIPVFPGGGPVDMMGDGKLINFNCGWKAVTDTPGAQLTILEFF